MFLARVAGTVVATMRDAGLGPRKLLLVRPLDRHGAALPRSLVALDAVGAGVGETVYCCRGKEAGFPWLPESVPTDAAIVGILDPASPSNAVVMSRSAGTGMGPHARASISGTRGEAAQGPAPVMNERAGR